MHPNELFPQDILTDKDLVVTYVICLSHLTPQRTKRMVEGRIIEVRPNEALLPLAVTNTLVSPEVFETQLETLQQLDIASVRKLERHYLVYFPKVRISKDTGSAEVEPAHGALPPITFATFSERYLQQVKCDTSPKNLENSLRVVKHANRHFGNILLATLEPKHLEEFKTKRLEEIRSTKGGDAGKTTVNMDIRTLKRALEYAIDWGYLKENPFRRIKAVRTQVRRPIAMSASEFNEMLMCVEDEKLKKFYRIALLTGMRRGELLFLTWERVDFEERAIYVYSSEEYRVKQGKGRTIPMSDEVEKILRSLRDNDPFVFMREDGRQYTEDYVTKKFKEAVRGADLREDFHLHCLRHTFATLLNSAGVPPMHTKDLLGHAYLKTTESYTSTPSKDLRAAIEMLTLPPA